VSPRGAGTSRWKHILRAAGRPGPRCTMRDERVVERTHQALRRQRVDARSTRQQANAFALNGVSSWQALDRGAAEAAARAPSKERPTGGPDPTRHRSGRPSAGSPRSAARRGGRRSPRRRRLRRPAVCSRPSRAGAGGGCSTVARDRTAVQPGRWFIVCLAREPSGSGNRRSRTHRQVPRRADGSSPGHRNGEFGC